MSANDHIFPFRIIDGLFCPINLFINKFSRLFGNIRTAIEADELTYFFRIKPKPEIVEIFEFPTTFVSSRPCSAHPQTMI
jgi:hypothetical protein